ncbi:hypothetical protein HOI18_04720 [Candidatus Uhrbacteria bacterium]|jgi:hypothetical protein|nr:hypothetical protein [Candidatus Uhrbacteria bacterium]
MPASRTTISFNEQNWKEVSKAKNKSAFVNNAVNFFVSTKKALKKKEEEFLLNELAHFEETNETYSLEEALK